MSNSSSEPLEASLAGGTLDAVRDSVEATDNAAAVAAGVAVQDKPRLLIQPADPHISVAALRDILAADQELFDRGMPVRLVRDPVRGGLQAHFMTPEGIVLKAHSVARPYKITKTGEAVDARMPRDLAAMYLDCRGDWKLPVLNGVSSAPLLRDDGEIFAKNGYDAATGMFLEQMPDLAGLLPDRPTSVEAAAALMLLRETFKTFCFSDAPVIQNEGGSRVVDTAKPPARDESAFLHALLTAVARPSLKLAPGILIGAAAISGAGSGKGLLARCMCSIAFGHQPHAVTGGASAEEVEKRIAAELMGGSSALFLDNLNNTNFKSDLLASAITERPARVRLLGKSQMVDLNASAFVVLTGNGLSVSEDLARRFLSIELDAGSESPEARKFTGDILAEVSGRRKELLAAALTIWRWGRQTPGLEAGLPLGSFEQWCHWIRDPLLALGCVDPAQRVSEAKERDGRRELVGEVYSTWWAHHGNQAVLASELHDAVAQVIDPHGRGRQFIASFLGRLVQTRMAGFVLTRQRPSGHWGAASYALVRTDDGQEHRGHRGHVDGHPLDSERGFERGPLAERDEVPGVVSPMPPMPPMPIPAEEKSAELLNQRATPEADADADDGVAGWSARL